MANKRQATVKRTTRETDIRIELLLDGAAGEPEIQSGVPFFDHMLHAFSCHGGFGLQLAVKGDLDVDAHHTMEDIGLALGQTLKDALGDKRGITRFGSSFVPMDESLARVVLDLSGRPHLSWRVSLPETIVGGVSGPAEEGRQQRGEGEAGGTFEKMAAAGDGRVIHSGIVSVLAGLGKS